MKEQSYELRATDYELEDNLENLNKIKVQTSMTNGHFGIIARARYNVIDNLWNIQHYKKYEKHIKKYKY